MQSIKFKQYKFRLTFLLLFSLFFSVLGVVDPENSGIKIGLVGLIAFLFVAIDYKVVTLDYDVIKQRHNFVSQLILERKNISMSILVAAIVIFFCQNLLINEFGTLEAVMLEYGIVYQKVNDGEKWRLLLGYLFHSGIPHLLINTILLIGFCALARPYSAKFIFIIFFIGCILSSTGAYFLYTLDLTNNDGFLGVSGGVTAVAGAVLIATINFKSYFPKYFYISFASFATSITFIDFISTSFMTASSHLIGFVSGFFISFVFLKFLNINYGES